MGVRIVGRHAALRTSSGGGWALFRSWIAVAERLGTDSEVAAVAEFLRSRLAPSYVHDFDLDPPPDELAAPARLRAFARINGAVADQLSRRKPDPGCNDEDLLFCLDWELRLRWLSQILDVHQMIVDLLPPAEAPSEPLMPELLEHERDQVNVDRWRTRLWELRRRQADPRTILALIEEGLPVATRLLSERNSWQLFQVHDMRANLHAELGEQVAAAEALRAAARYSDGDLAEATIDLADEYSTGG